MQYLRQSAHSLPLLLLGLLVIIIEAYSVPSLSPLAAPESRPRGLPSPSRESASLLERANPFKSGGPLSFEPLPLPPNPAAFINAIQSEEIYWGAISLPADIERLFEGGSDSLVARAIGAAEGTRQPTGEKTAAYSGHIDPGNGVWNLGTFSYQHGASSPQEADRKQLARLRRQVYKLHRQAIQLDVPWGLEEQLNGLDLANQSPEAALSRAGYLDRLKEAYEQGYNGSSAILQARTYAYLNPDTQQWDAPGLGNTLTSIRADQQRRLQAVQAAIAASGSR